MENGLFPALIGHERWIILPPAVRRMHDGTNVDARGVSTVEGAMTIGARVLRRLLRLPEPGSSATLRFSLTADSDGEQWTRFFASRRMQSRLDRSPLGQGWLRERLGASTLHFELVTTPIGVDWRIRAMRIGGLPVPHLWLRGIVASSGERDGRYHFRTAARLPLVGLLVAYEGWLERVD